MTILVDTSAWIEFYHPRGSERVKAALADALTTHDVATTAPIQAPSGSPARRASR
ncbi:MAG: hypothetical protein Kow001_24740 [Acidobacteriota bacterium]